MGILENIQEALAKSAAAHKSGLDAKLEGHHSWLAQELEALRALIVHNPRDDMKAPIQAEEQKAPKQANQKRKSQDLFAASCGSPEQKRSTLSIDWSDYATKSGLPVDLNKLTKEKLLDALIERGVTDHSMKDLKKDLIDALKRVVLLAPDAEVNEPSRLSMKFAEAVEDLPEPVGIAEVNNIQQNLNATDVNPRNSELIDRADKQISLIESSLINAKQQPPVEVNIEVPRSVEKAASQPVSRPSDTLPTVASPALSILSEMSVESAERRAEKVQAVEAKPSAMNPTNEVSATANSGLNNSLKKPLNLSASQASFLTKEAPKIVSYISPCLITDSYNAITHLMLIARIGEGSSVARAAGGKAAREDAPGETARGAAAQTGTGAHHRGDGKHPKDYSNHG